MHYCARCRKMMPLEHNIKECWLEAFRKIQENIKQAKEVEELEALWQLDSSHGR